MAVVAGDPGATGPFAFRFRMPDGYWICPHTHPVTARIQVISGSLLVGMGPTLDRAKARTWPAGSEIQLEANMAHFEGTRAETVIEISGSGTWGITFLDPRRDPSVAAASPSCRP